jgi:tetratricopeptide (TPR) repeat protein
MAIEGSLGDVSLPDISQLLGMGGKTGCLSLTYKNNFGYVYFEDGRVIYASVVNRTARLGDLLVANGVIDRHQLAAGMETHGREKGKMLGEVLVEMGALKEDDLYKYITIQIEEAVYRVFQWNEGSFQFKPDIEPPDGVFQISLSVDAVLMEGARRVDEWSVVEKKISSMDLVFALERDPLAEEGLDLTDDQRRIIPLVDGKRSVNDLIDASGLVEFDTGKALYALIQAGFAIQVGRRVAEDGAQGSVEEHLNLGLAFYRSGMMEDSSREFRKTLEADASHPQARAHLALISLRGGRAQEAIVHFKEMAEGTEPTYALLRNRSLAFERMGRFDEALADLEEAEKLDSDNPELLLARGIVHVKARDGVAAMGSFKAYQDKLGSDKPSPMFCSFSILAAGIAGDMDRAVQIGREGLEQYPEAGPILVNVGAALEHRGDNEAAEAFYERATKSENPPPQSFKALGDHALKRGDKVRAKQQFELAIKADPRLGEDVLIKLGAIALENSESAEAGEMWRRALEINPDNASLQAKLDQLGAAAGA